MTADPADIDWIAADWGTTHLRLSAIAADGAVLGTRSSDKGMGRLERDGFEPALIELAGDWLGDAPWPPVLACGMVGSRQGWVEAPYRPVPAPPLSAGVMACAPVRDPRLSVHVVPGLRQDDPPDVMRGEETQIAGYLAQVPEFEGVICLPGTHGKWAAIRQGRVERFQTFLTGELFDLLSRELVLRHTVAGEGWDDAAFAEGLETAQADPARIGAEFFALRARALLQGLDPVSARSRLSGLLIGQELAMARDFWSGAGAIAVIGAPTIGRAYARALRIGGTEPDEVDAAGVTLAGLGAARARQPRERA